MAKQIETTPGPMSCMPSPTVNQPQVQKQKSRKDSGSTRSIKCQD